MFTITKTSELKDKVGSELGVSDWYEVTQERIDAFAEATGDFNRVHVDPEWAAKTPMQSTIAHGLFTLSLGPQFVYQLLDHEALSLALNYGYDKVRFTAPVKAGARVRMRATLSDVKEIDGGARVYIQQTYEIEGQEKPACVADQVSVYYD